MPPSRIACLLPGSSSALQLDALVDAATAFSPEIERASDAVFLEVGDLRRLYPTEEALTAALLFATSEVGVSACVAIASDKAVARVGARGLHLLRRDGQAAILVAGSEKRALAELPIAALGPPPELLTRLEVWGLRTVGDLAALPRPQVVTRLGAAGAVLHRLACGESNELLQKTPPSTEIREEQALLDALDNLEPLLFVLRGLVDRLTARLRARSQACGNLELRLTLSPRGEEVRQIAVAAPTQQVAPLLTLLRVALESQPPSATVERLTIITTPTTPRQLQLDLFAPPGPAPERLATTLARLTALCGSGRVGRPVVPDSHVPGAATLTGFAPKPMTAAAPGEEPTALLSLATRVVRPPRPVAVQRRDGALCEVVLDATPRGTTPRTVRRSGGPYRLTDVRGARDYYDVELSEGELLRIFYDLVADRWFLDAVYD